MVQKGQFTAGRGPVADESPCSTADTVAAVRSLVGGEWGRRLVRRKDEPGTLEVARALRNLLDVCGSDIPVEFSREDVRVEDPR
jgi:hypothetical protein